MTAPSAVYRKMQEWFTGHKKCLRYLFAMIMLSSITMLVLSGNSRLDRQDSSSKRAVAYPTKLDMELSENYELEENLECVSSCCASGGTIQKCEKICLQSENQSYKNDKKKEEPAESCYDECRAEQVSERRCNAKCTIEVSTASFLANYGKLTGNEKQISNGSTEKEEEDLSLLNQDCVAVCDVNALKCLEQYGTTKFFVNFCMNRRDEDISKCAPN